LEINLSIDNNTLVYYDIGAINGCSVPFKNGDNDKYLKRWIGFDPNFKEEYRANGKNIFYGYAVSDVEGVVKYNISKREVNNSLFVANKEKFTGIHGRQKVLPREVRDICCRRLENVISDNNGEIDILKIDAHGSEYPILQGVGRYLKDIIIIHAEIWNEGWYVGSVGGDKTYKFLIDNGFIPTIVMEVPRVEKSWIDVVFLNKFASGDKYDLCRKLYYIGPRKMSKQIDTMRAVEKKMGWE
jgi:FkbM family methyltransferase